MIMHILSTCLILAGFGIIWIFQHPFIALLVFIIFWSITFLLIHRRSKKHRKTGLFMTLSGTFMFGIGVIFIVFAFHSEYENPRITDPDYNYHVSSIVFYNTTDYVINGIQILYEENDEIVLYATADNIQPGEYRKIKVEFSPDEYHSIYVNTPNGNYDSLRYEGNNTMDDDRFHVLAITGTAESPELQNVHDYSKEYHKSVKHDHKDQGLLSWY